MAVIYCKRGSTRIIVFVQLDRLAYYSVTTTRVFSTTPLNGATPLLSFSSRVLSQTVLRRYFRVRAPAANYKIN